MVAVVLAAIAIPVVAGLRDEAAGERARAAQRQAALEAAERARQVRDARPVRARGPVPAAGADPLAQRATLVRHAEGLIAADARGRVAAGTLDGSPEGVSCSPFPATAARRAAERDAATPAGRYDCVAYTSRLQAPEQDGQKRTVLFGHPYRLVIEYASAQLVWCKIAPLASEGARSLVAVPVPAACRGPAGPG